jgi:hypothetical protein
MPRFLFVFSLMLAFALTGCTTLNRRDQHLLDSYGISGPTYDRMRHHEPLTLDDIIYLSQRGVPGPFIVHYLRPTYAVYNLSGSDVARLRQAKVEEGVIRYLQATPGMFSPSRMPTWVDDSPRPDMPYWDYRRY